ncbi:hypothetical protein SAY87_003178 [Trapa incisa]|uniref:TOG domain-containing protein n=1 Tax=Trapa incisa TaxID=236973 RepID=A0AAN7KS36_9MYRT|nr:hypothetical protein SAY87_003178 [Trapa incisa]
MTTLGPKPSKPSKPHSSQSQPNPRLPIYSSISSHMAMMEHKQKILTSLSKLADRDTYQIAVSDLENTVQTISADAIPMLLNCFFESSNDPKTSVKKESIRLLAFTCSTRGDSMFNYLPRIIAHLSRRLRDSDSGVPDACRDAIGKLSAQYLKNEGVATLFVKPLFEAMGEQNKAVQCGAAMCMSKVVECAAEPPVAAFQKMCPRVSKLLHTPKFLAKGSLLPVVSSLSRVGAISPQSFDSLLQGVQDCLGSPNWVTRKAAAEALATLAMYSSNLITDGAVSILTTLEGCRFDKIKPVRDSMLEALQLWRNIFGKGDGCPDDQKSVSQESENHELQEMENGVADHKTKEGSMLDKTVDILKKKVPALTDKELNPEFFQKLETRSSGDLPVEVIVPRRFLNSSTSGNGEESGLNVAEWRLRSFHDDKIEETRGESTATLAKAESQSEGGPSNRTKGNLIAIQRQLLQLERQQSHFMSMVQDFMGGSHDSMITMDNRVRGLERVVEDMARDLSISSGRRVGGFPVGFDEMTARPLGKHNGYSNYHGWKFRRGERFVQSEGAASSLRGRSFAWESDISRNWQTMARKGFDGGRRVLNKEAAPARHGNGPSARSIRQASKDEATLEAIHVGREYGKSSWAGTVAVPKLAAEALEDDNLGQEIDPVWTSWTNAMNALQVGDVDVAYAELLSTGDDLLLIKLMDMSGPAIDRLSNQVAVEVLSAIAQFLQEQNLLDICLSWIQQVHLISFLYPLPVAHFTGDLFYWQRSDLQFFHI